MGIIAGGMDSARLRNQKLYNNWVKGRWAANRKTSPESGLLSVLDERRGKVCLREHLWEVGLCKGGFCFIENFCKANLWTSLKMPFIKPALTVTGITWCACWRRSWNLTSQIHFMPVNMLKRTQVPEGEEKGELVGCSSFAPPFNACSCAFARCVKRELGPLQRHAVSPECSE